MWAPTNKVAILLSACLSSSSKVTISKLLCVLAHCAYASRCRLAHLSPADTAQLCMSWQRFGTTHENTGSFVKSVGNDEYFLLTAYWSRSVKFVQGACLRA